MNKAYVNQKTGCQGGLTTALLLSNVTLTKRLLKEGNCTEDFICMVGIICLGISIFMQMIGGVLLIIVARREQRTGQLKKEVEYAQTNPSKKDEEAQTNPSQSEKNQADVKVKNKLNEIRRTEHLNTTVLVITFIVTVMNIFINGLEFD